MIPSILQEIHTVVDLEMYWGRSVFDLNTNQGRIHCTNLIIHGILLGMSSFVCTLFREDVMRRNLKKITTRILTSK